MDETLNIPASCRNLAEDPEDFRCSACGTMKFDIFAVRYCPNCGREVIWRRQSLSPTRSEDGRFQDMGFLI